MFFVVVVVVVVVVVFCHLIVKIGDGNGTQLQYSCLEKSHGWRSLVGCNPWGR